MRNVLTMMLLLCAAGVVSGQTVLDIETDGYLHHSQWANWSHDGTTWVIRSGLSARMIFCSSLT